MYQKQREWITTCCPELSQSQKEQYLAILDNLEKQKQALSQEEVMAYAAKIRPVLFGSNGEAVLDPKPQDNQTARPCLIPNRKTRSFTGLRIRRLLR